MHVEVVLELVLRENRLVEAIFQMILRRTKLKLRRLNVASLSITAINLVIHAIKAAVLLIKT